MAWLKRYPLILLFIILAIGITIGYFSAKKSSSQGQKTVNSLSANPTYLLVKREPFPNSLEDQEIHGYVVSFHGAVNQTLLLTQSIDESQAESLPLIQGQELQTDEFEWAGVKTKIIYVRSSDKLQIQREIMFTEEIEEDVSTEALPRDALLTLDLHESVAVEFAKPE